MGDFRPGDLRIAFAGVRRSRWQAPGESNPSTQTEKLALPLRKPGTPRKTASYSYHGIATLGQLLQGPSSAGSRDST
jgi:hypothetical protein